MASFAHFFSLPHCTRKVYRIVYGASMEVTVAVEDVVLEYSLFLDMPCFTGQYDRGRVLNMIVYRSVLKIYPIVYGASTEVPVAVEDIVLKYSLF